MGYIIGAGGAVLFVSMIFLLISKEKSLRGIEKQRKELEQEVKVSKANAGKQKRKIKKYGNWQTPFIYMPLFRKKK